MTAAETPDTGGRGPGEPPSLIYAPDLGAPGSLLQLSKEESHYLARVCRARAGDHATATDGRGALARLRLESVGKEVRAEVVSVERSERGRRAWVLCGAPERGRGDWLVEKLAELGVQRFQPLECEGGSWPAAEARFERWNRLAIGALRQSRRAFLMEVRAPVAVEEALAALEPGASCWLGDLEGRSPGPGDPGERVTVGAIGPAGGFTASERKRFEVAGFAPVRLADGRLRTETAALSWASWWAAAGAGGRAAGRS
ncbi:MAG TPA: RsmE family RNA methyltransferase [Candidatus Eisenbacteria bacterium]